MSARESQRAGLREPCAAFRAGDAASRLRNGLRRLAAMPDSMLELQAAGGPRADSHAVTGVVSIFDTTSRLRYSRRTCVLGRMRSRARPSAAAERLLWLMGAAGGPEAARGPESATLHALFVARAVHRTLVPCCSRPADVFWRAWSYQKRCTTSLTRKKRD